MELLSKAKTGKVCSMGYFFAAYYKRAFGKYLNPEENS